MKPLKCFNNMESLIACGCDSKGSHKTRQSYMTCVVVEPQSSKKLIFCWLWQWGWQPYDYNNVMMVTMVEVWRILKTSYYCSNLIAQCMHKKILQHQFRFFSRFTILYSWYQPPKFSNLHATILSAKVFWPLPFLWNKISF